MPKHKIDTNRESWITDQAKVLDAFKLIYPNAEDLLETSVPLDEIRADPHFNFFPEDKIFPIICEPGGRTIFLYQGLLWTVIEPDSSDAGKVFTKFEILTDMKVAQALFAITHAVKRSWFGHTPKDQLSARLQGVIKLYEDSLTRCLHEKDLLGLLKIIRDNGLSRSWFGDTIVRMSLAGTETLQTMLEIMPQAVIKYATERYINKADWFHQLRHIFPNDLFFQSGKIQLKKLQPSRPEIAKQAFLENKVPSSDQVMFDFLISKRWDQTVKKYEPGKGSLGGYIANGADYHLWAKSRRKEASEPFRRWEDLDESTLNLHAYNALMNDAEKTIEDDHAQKEKRNLIEKSVQALGKKGLNVKDATVALLAMQEDLDRPISDARIAEVLDKSPAAFRKAKQRLRAKNKP